MKIACLHAAESNIALFQQSLQQLAAPGVTLAHQVEAQLLADAEQAAAMTPEIIGMTQRVIAELCQQADAVIISCTTLGGAAAESHRFSKPVLRLDATLVDQAFSGSHHILVLCTAPTTLAPTRALFLQRQSASRQVTVACVPDAWAQFKAGNLAAYHRCIAGHASDYLAQHRDCDCLVLAQSSMSDAVGYINTRVKILTGPTASLQAAIALNSSGQQG
ncbi:hypothetical protein J2125_004527 [Erwinia toletana]|uniref:Asp/Glu racemase n=1 Tax=Winslowiella toletana TaxID=92490 RepID=A0ABS4PFC4_9GAMM|nr:aspartate/glutamate racemase family protein [Winslowiella toletana]MBP2171335.1 hypothetical protein [Winslowiella toletana]